MEKHRPMNRNFRYAGWILLLVIALGIKILSLFPAAVERYYSNGVYPYISRALRWLFGWIPFSVGDLLYAAAALYLIAGVIRLVKKIARRHADTAFLLRLGVKVMILWLWIYILFNGLWGLNYNRQGIARQAQLPVSNYDKREVDTLVVVLADRLNRLREDGIAERLKMHRKRILFGEAFQTYRELGEHATFLQYGGQSVKPSLYSYLGNYLGFTGYYNPFTGEAQVNTTVPVFVQPFTTCHEIGHQLGYAKENEANMAGFLTARNSASAAFRYSAYFDLYLYAMRELAVRDSSRAKDLYQRLSPGVRTDITTLRDFNNRHVGLLEPVVRSLYAQYLRINQQPGGMMSYNQVVALVIAYARRYGYEKL